MLSASLLTAIACGLYLRNFIWRPPPKPFFAVNAGPSAAESELKSIRIHSKDELTRLDESEYLFLFIDADWSLTAKQSGAVFLELREGLRSHADSARMKFRSIDTTDQSDDPLWQDYLSWLERHDVDPGVMTSGSGTIILAKEGKVVSTIWCPAVEGIDNIFATTKARFRPSTETPNR